MKRGTLGVLCAAGCVAAYLYWPGNDGMGSEAAAAAPDAGSPSEVGRNPEQDGPTPVLTELDESPQPLVDVHRIQAELHDLPEGPRARAVREMLDRVAFEARRNGESMLLEQPVSAWKALSLAYFATTDARVRGELKPTLDKLAADLILSRRPVEELFTQATIESGSNLLGIARNHECSWRFVARINGITDPRRIRAGDRLKIPTGEVEIHVRKRSFLLLATYSGGYLRAYEVGTGKFDSTPETEFRIVEQEIEPTWYGPDGVYPFGHEKNILGTRWLGFNRDEFSGIGIHGTSYPETIGTESSAGCIRMRNPEVEELFDFVKSGVRVTITK